MVEVIYAYIIIGIMFISVVLYNQRSDFKSECRSPWHVIMLKILLSITLWPWLVPFYIYENWNNIKKWLINLRENK